MNNQDTSEVKQLSHVQLSPGSDGCLPAFSFSIFFPSQKTILLPCSINGYFLSCRAAVNQSLIHLPVHCTVATKQKGNTDEINPSGTETEEKAELQHHRTGGLLCLFVVRL